MAELGVIMAMISLASNATSILGIVKRRCGASQTIAELATKCEEIVGKIHELLKMLEGGSQVPHSAHRISTVLNHRRQEFEAISGNLEKINRRIERTHPLHRTENFIKAQGWARRMHFIQNELDNLRNGIENIATNWDVAEHVVTKVEEIRTIDVRKREESRWQRSNETGTGNYVERMLTMMVKLNDTSREALSRYGRLDANPFPEALHTACSWFPVIGEIPYLQLLQNSVELLHPESNWLMGIEYKCGGRMEKNLDLAVSCFRVASSRGELNSIMELIALYAQQNDRKNLSKYVEMAARVGLLRKKYIHCDRYSTRYGFENDEFKAYLIRASTTISALNQSMCHSIGVGASKSKQKVFEALPSFDSNSYTVHFHPDKPYRFYIRPDCYRWLYKYSDWRWYLDLLLEADQFLLFLTLSYDTKIYSSRELKEYALFAASKGCLDAHVFLAEYYSASGRRNEREMRQHLVIAADHGNSQAHTVCRRMFGKNVNLSREVWLKEEKRDNCRGEERHPACTKKPNTGG